MGARRFLPLYAVLLASCGGGGGSNSGPPAGGPPPPNNPPTVALPNDPQRAVHLHPFQYDPTQGGMTFSDPDGDPLQYDIVLGHTWNPYSDPDPPHGLRVEGNIVVGAPEELGVVVVTITASDGRNSTTNNQFWIQVDPNSPPVVNIRNSNMLVSVGGFVDVEASKGGSAFSDPDGDSLSYELTLRGQPRGLAINGTRVSGVFDSIGLVELTVSASDTYGGVGSDVFLVAAPAPEPGAPTLPDPSYVYRDDGLDLPFVFQDSFFDTSPQGNRTTDAGATLGRVLFYDKRVSITNTVACASCHQQAHGFSIPERFGTGALGVLTTRSPMPLANVRFNLAHAWFSDMRVSSLQELVLLPIQNPEELGSPLALLESKLRATPFYPPLFEAAFGTPEITHGRIALALEQFLQSLMSYRTKSDLAFNPMFNGPGDPASVLTAQELRGSEIFNDDAAGRCSTCHDLRTSINIWHANNGIDAIPSDPGTVIPAFQRNGSIGVFRAPALRNIATSAPYMHDGCFATLRDVVNHYDHGIQDSQNLDAILRDQLGGPMRLNLSEEDKDALEAFLDTLTDDEFLTDPKFSDPFN